MSADLRQQVIAFAGILQAGELVRQIATGGQCSQQSARACIESVFANEPESTEAVFGGLPGVRLGLTMANELAASASNDARQAMGYAGGLMRLSMFLRKDPSLNLVEAAWRDAGDVLDPSVIAQLADVYRQQISTLPLRIQVHGNPQYLKQNDKVSLIRAILLGGVRAGFLWLQLGGRPWRLLFQRGRMFRIAAELSG
jgi:high frequency lysogenization protein